MARGKAKGVRVTPPKWEVLFHPDALAEHKALDSSDRVAVQGVIGKLKVDGPALRAPHQKAVMQSAGEGLRELRPTAGRNPWRPLYRRVDDKLYAILAIAPEAEIDASGFNKAVKIAQGRRRAIEGGRENKDKARAGKTTKRKPKGKAKG